MAEQRDRLVALKKKEREEKVRQEEELNRKMAGEASSPKRQIPVHHQAQPKRDQDEEDELESQEQQRAVLRLALARRMKQGLIESEEAKLSAHEDQFNALDRKLQDVERQRQENQQRELLLQENLRKQQAQMARNVQKSAQQLRSDRDA